MESAAAVDGDAAGPSPSQWREGPLAAVCGSEGSRASVYHRWVSGELFVPEDFVVPDGLSADRFRLEPLGPQHNEADYAAWMTSIDHIRATPGFPYQGWPREMTLQENLRDLERHARDFAGRRGFTYTVLEAGSGGVIGCVYIYPARGGPGRRRAAVSSWVRADRAELDSAVYDAILAWLERDWPFDALERMSFGSQAPPARAGLRPAIS